MALFQRTVINKYLKELDGKILASYKKFTDYFHNTEIQENIRNSKEEQFQEGFLRELFVKILGYTIHPEPGFNLITEKKNVTDSKKADAAFSVNNEVVGVIELKDTKITNLRTVEVQAFGYKNSHRNAVYVVISNFEKLNFYIDNTIDYIEFNLFTLSKNDFSVLWLCLEYNNIVNNLPKQLKIESISTEDQITKQLYKEYAGFKRELFDDLIKNNPDYDKLTLFKKSQKILDRLLFILFAENCGLLPPNSIRFVLDQWEDLKKMDEYRPLYDRFKKYFSYMNTGHKGQKHDIFAYNGGLFAEDDILEKLVISDNVLNRNLLIISKYDFSSEVDVNILGHIFENSLTEIEEISNAITSNTDYKSVISKRKKDGVFYTPRYITAYIVENTVGKLCFNKKKELNIEESEYFSDKKRTKASTQKLENKLIEYRNWLLSLTICDPACGSGAFLNAALDFLISEHSLIDEMRAKIYGGEYQLFENIENVILENNLYGVDINEESVEIAKLALWLRTAKPNRKLNVLNENIKCGNSLISDPAVAGDKAFNWEKEFPPIFEKGGFDVVIGNPPYVFAREKVSDFEKEYYTKYYYSAKYQINTYILFMEKAFLLTIKNGLCGLIIPNSWLMVYSGEDLRRFMMANCTLNQIVSLFGRSFEDANVETVIMIAEHKQCDANNETIILKNDENKSSFLTLHTRKQMDFNENKGLEFNVFSDDKSTRIIEKMKSGSENLDDVCSVKAGLKAYQQGKGKPKQTSDDVKNRPFDFNYKYNQDTYKYLEGKDVLRYGISWSGSWLWFGSHLAEPRKFDCEKIIIREITSKYPHCIIATYTDEMFLFNISNIAVVKREGFNISLKYVIVLLNSSLMSYYFIKNTAKAERKLFPKIILNDLRLFPIKQISLPDQQLFIELADKMLSFNSELMNYRK